MGGKGGRSGTRSLLSDLVMDLKAVVPTTEQAPPGGVGGWACQMGVALDRGPFSFSRHEFLEVPYADDHPLQVEKKCAQMGNTTRAILRCFHAALFRGFVGILYLFPSKTGSSDFSKTRVGPLIENNPDSLGRWVQETDAVGVKRIKRCNLLFRGTKSTEGVRSDPTDFNVYDEFDLFAFAVEETAEERMAHSDFGWEHYLSNPTLPDFGIDRKFQETDQRYWLLKCPRCGGWTDPVGEWEASAKPKERGVPELLWEMKDGTVVLRCMRCREGILDPARGEWVARKPGVTDARGYQYSQLFSQYVKLPKLLKKYLTAKDIQAFYNYKLGLAYVDAEHRITKEEVLALCGSHGIAASDPGPCCMGVDQGKGLHVVIGRRDGTIVHIGEYRDFEELDRLMVAFNVSRCVIDGMPETRKAREFAARFPMRVFLNWYSPHQKGGYAWNEEKFQVSVNRTESMDAAHEALTGKRLALPRQCGPVEEFATHCANTAKKLEEDEETGSKTYTWVKLGPDHYRHAHNYWCIAADFSSNSFFSGMNLR